MSAPVTVLLTRRVRAGRQPEFEEFLEHVHALAAAQPGNQGMTIIPPPAGSTEYAIVYRFATSEHLRRWRSSAERATLMEGSGELAESAPVERELAGFEGWFAGPDGQVMRPPARWKTWLTTVLAIYVLLVAITAVSEPVLAPLPPPLRLAIVLPMLTALMTWVVMPAMSRILANWLYD